MHRTTRMTGILIALQSQPRTAQALADRFEVSRRTILRDIDELMQLGVPIEARTGPNGGYSLSRTWWLAPTQLTEQEVQTLLFALDHLGDDNESPWATAQRDLVDKLRAALHPGAFDRALADPTRPEVLTRAPAPDEATLAIVRSAIARDSWMRVEYQGGSAPGERRMKPRAMHVQAGRWYVQALDERSGEFRHFRLDRMANPRLCLDPPNAVALYAKAAARPDYHAPEHPEIALRLTARGRMLAMEHPDFRQHLDGECIRFRCPPSEIPYYGRELIGFGTDVQILGPPELREWMRAQLVQLHRHHQ